MLNIFELNEEQLREYAVSQSKEAAENFTLDDALEKFRYIERAYNKQKAMFEKVEELVSERRFDDAYDACSELGIALDRLSSRVKTYPFEIGEKSSNKKFRLDKIKNSGKELKFERGEGFLRIVLPEMLPHKQQYDTETNKMKYYYDIDSWKAGYYNQFLKEFETGKYRIFSEKVSICYIIHVAPSMNKGIADTDNYDTKVMTDIITTFLLTDDNFLCCNFMVDVVLDDNCKDIDDCYTDIIICPADRREEVLKRV